MVTVSTAGLTGSGFSEAQASAITKTVEATANDAFEILRHDLARWHAYLALYMLIQMSIVLVALIAVQVIQQPPRANVSTHVSHPDIKSPGNPNVDFW
jgi:hypothetical protein